MDAKENVQNILEKREIIRIYWKENILEGKVNLDRSDGSMPGSL